MSIMAEVHVTSDDDDDEDDADDEDDDDDSPPEFQGGRGRRRRHEGPAVKLLNYKDVGTLSRFLTESGKILPKRTTKVNAPFQRQLGRAVKRARYLGLIPYVRDHEV
jgi:small subunit ribosomal protein S18